MVPKKKVGADLKPTATTSWAKLVVSSNGTTAAAIIPSHSPSAEVVL